ncbi:iron-siderophore ABC transporter substrate-binding protein [Tomitella biformata]|uniref:iron-siderophore ABC transporter substrate-binding protein n=1 Tax=Tomitella biformata TaxID=630403 RepID=UPI000571FE2A|nr:iron-siderophore ABC transporter substrate-binding protein [Tomitella biformata]
MTIIRESLRTLTALLAGLLLLSACGSGPDEVAGGDTFAVEHAYGVTDVPVNPQRVVSVGYTDDQTLLALGIKPVGMVDQYPAGDGVDANISWPWVERLWDGVVPEVVMTNGESLNFEKVAALQPDLIVGVYSDMTADDYARLTKIAPTVAWAKDVEDPFAAPWEATARQIARAVGKEAEATELIDAITAQIAQVKAENPQFSGKTAVAFSVYQNALAPFASTDVRGKLLSDLGFASVPEIDAAAGAQFYAMLSPEHASLLDVDRAFFIGDAADQETVRADPLFRSLPVFTEGRVAYLADSEPPAVGAALSQSTVASLHYAIDQVVAAAND